MNKALNKKKTIAFLILVVMLFGVANISSIAAPAKTGSTKTAQCTSASKAHSFKKTIKKAATCTKDGKETVKCTICGFTRTNSIYRTGHKYKSVVKKQATTKKNGYIMKKKCANCGKIVEFSKKKTISKIKTIKLSKTEYNYNGKKHVPSVTVKDSEGNVLTQNKDYTVTYSNENSEKVGKYKVTVTFKGKYSGTKVLKYNITEKEHKYQLKFDPNADTDTRATFNSNGKVTIGVCEGCGNKIKFEKAGTIYMISSVKLSNKRFYYVGLERVPSVTVKESQGKKLKENVDYIVKYSNPKSKEIGTYTVTVTFKGNYSGTKTLEYKIDNVLPEVSGKDLTKFDWSEYDKDRAGLIYDGAGNLTTYDKLAPGEYYMEYDKTGHLIDEPKCKPNPNDKPIDYESLRTCEFCGKTTMYNGYIGSRAAAHGGCARFNSSVKCPYCEVTVPANTCHTCKKVVWLPS